MKYYIAMQAKQDTDVIHYPQNSCGVDEMKDGDIIHKDTIIHFGHGFHTLIRSSGTSYDTADQATTRLLQLTYPHSHLDLFVVDANGTRTTQNTYSLPVDL